VREKLNQTALTAVAEDIEYLRSWWEHSPAVADNTMIRHGSAALRRLLIEDVASKAWRQSGFEKSPTLQGPDLLAFFRRQGIDVPSVVGAIAADVRFAGIDFAFINAHKIDHPATAVPATAEEGFAISSGAVLRDTRNPTSSELDNLVNRTWRMHEYLNSPGLIRLGQKVSRREVIKHMANEMGGVHIGKNTTSNVRELLHEAEESLFIKAKGGSSLRTYFIEILAIGQSIGRSADLQNLAATIRNQRSTAAR
jgi:hypothetical protein